MSLNTLKNTNINKLINNDTNMLTIKELLNKINYNYNNIYIDKFWDNIENDKWIYIDTEIILWMEYKDVKIGKEKIIKFLKSNFLENEDYKILSNSEFDINNFCFTATEEQNITEETRGGSDKTNFDKFYNNIVNNNLI